MRKRAWLVLCGMMFCGSVRAADSVTLPDARQQREALALYARRFDNAYMIASRDRPAANAAPYDAVAAGPAQDIHDQAQSQCEARPAEFSTGRAWMECFLEADKAFASTAKVDATLLAAFEDAVRYAADDADSGKLTPQQLDSVYFLISEAYAAIIHDQYAAWKNAHPKPP